MAKTLAERLKELFGVDRTAGNNLPARGPLPEALFSTIPGDTLRARPTLQKARTVDPEVLAVLEDEAEKERRRNQRRTGQRANLSAGLLSQGSLSAGATLGRRSLLAG